MPVRGDPGVSTMGTDRWLKRYHRIFDGRVGGAVTDVHLDFRMLIVSIGLSWPFIVPTLVVGRLLALVLWGLVRRNVREVLDAPIASENPFAGRMDTELLSRSARRNGQFADRLSERALTLQTVRVSLSSRLQKVRRL